MSKVTACLMELNPLKMMIILCWEIPAFVQMFNLKCFRFSGSEFESGVRYKKKVNHEIRCIRS